MVWNLHTQKHTFTNTRRDRRENSGFGERIAGSSEWRKRHPFGQLFWFFGYDQQLQLPASTARNSMVESFLGNPLTLIKLRAGRRSFACTTHRTVSALLVVLLLLFLLLLFSYSSSSKSLSSSGVEESAEEMTKTTIDLPPKGGFSFDLCRRNAFLESQGTKMPKFRKTGTTIVGLVFKVNCNNRHLLFCLSDRRRIAIDFFRRLGWCFFLFWDGFWEPMGE